MPILTKDTLEFISRSPDQTLRVGARLGRHLNGGDILALEGDLGSGKTVFAQGIGMGWGASSRLVSPTYVLVRRHRRHQDALRALPHRSLPANHRCRVEMLGLEEVIGAPETVSLVEWPERHMGLFRRIVSGCTCASLMSIAAR